MVFHLAGMMAERTGREAAITPRVRSTRVQSSRDLKDPGVLLVLFFGESKEAEKKKPRP